MNAWVFKIASYLGLEVCKWKNTISADLDTQLIQLKRCDRE